MLIYLVLDTSGSMGEYGKLLIARGLARAVEQYLRFGYGQAEVKLIAWNKNTRIVDWSPDEEFPVELLASSDSAHVKPLATLLETQPAGKVLLLTDGFWSREDEKELKCWKQSLPPNTIRIIKIGTDSNPRLKGNDVFVAEDLFAALDGWLEADSA